MKNFIYMRWIIVMLLGSVFLTSCDLQADPVIVDQAVDEACGARITYVDHAPANKASYVFLRRSNDGTQFSDIKIAKPNGEETAVFVDEGKLPIGTYYYMVGYFTSDEVHYSEVSEPVVISDDSCDTELLINKPLNPILLAVTQQSTCDASIQYVIYAEDYDGIRIYRRSQQKSEAVIADLSPQDIDNLNGFFYDLGLPPGTYRYRVSAYNENGESFSELGDEVVITDQSCHIPYAPTETNPIVPINTVGLSTTSPLPALVYTSTPEPQACVWEAVINVFLRKGPNIELFEKAAAIEQGTILPIIGQSEFGNFWLLEFQPGRQGYVSKSENIGRTSGDCSGVPTQIDPIPPVIEAIATQAPEETGGDEDAAGAPECSDGIDNDGDGAADMRDLAGCTSSDDPIED